MPQIIIVGAGISGLTAAYRIQQKLPTAEITLLEKNSKPGGTIGTDSRQGFRVEIGPNGFLDTKPTTLDLVKEIGLADQLVNASEGAAKNRYLFLGDGLKLLPNSFGSFLKSDLLSWRGKISFLMERFRRKGSQADESIAGFAHRRAGKEVAEVFADAMVTGIFGGDPTLLSMPACFPRMVTLEREYGSVLKGMAKSAKQRRKEAAEKGVSSERPGKLWSLRDGLGTLIQGLAEKLQRPPEVGVTVTSIQLENGNVNRWQVKSQEGKTWSADLVLLTCPAGHQGKIISSLDEDLGKLISEIPYNRIAVIAMGYRREDVPMELDGFGYIAPQNTRRDILGVQWCSSIYPRRAPGGMVLLRALCGGWHRSDMVEMDDETLLVAVKAELQKAMEITAEPVFQQVIRWDPAIPQYHLGHLSRVNEIDSRLEKYPGLMVGGNAYRGVAMNDCVEQGEVLAVEVQQFFSGNQFP